MTSEDPVGAPRLSGRNVWSREGPVVTHRVAIFPEIDNMRISLLGTLLPTRRGLANMQRGTVQKGRGRRGLPATVVLVAVAMAGCSSSGSSGSSDATLKLLTVSTGTLSPAFSPAASNYGVAVSAATTSITVTPTANEVHATIAVIGATVASGSPSVAEPLSTGPNLIDIAVTAQDGFVRIYDVTVTRAQ